MRKILNNGEKTRQRKNKKRKKKKKGGSKGCLQALLVTCMRHHACRTPKRPVANAFHATERDREWHLPQRAQLRLRSSRPEVMETGQNTKRGGNGMGAGGHTRSNGGCVVMEEKGGGSRVTSRCRRRWCRQTAAPGRPARRRSWRPEPARWPRRCSAPCREAAAAGSDM